MSNIRVCVRARPPLRDELGGRHVAFELEAGSEASIRIKKDGEPKCFFSRVWGMDSTQEEIFEAVGRPSVNDVLEGFHATVFVYGQTGTGKTYTLGCTQHGKEGIQPRVIAYLFERVNDLRASVEIRVDVEFIQLYRESILDLLDTTRDKLSVKVDDRGDTVVQGNTTIRVSSAESFRNLVQQAERNRATANTKLNSSSSRSHSCLITTVTCLPHDGSPPSVGRLFLVDLAGSERVSKSGATGEALQEAVSINKSLTVLGSCIHGIVNGERHVPFRDSKLTRLLQQCLLGKGRTTVIVTVHPSPEHVAETACTLRFGERAMKVQTQMTISDYREKLDDLDVKLARQQEEYAARWSDLKEYEKAVAVLDTACKERENGIKNYDSRIAHVVTETKNEVAAVHRATLEKHTKQLESQRDDANHQVEILKENNKEKLGIAEGKRVQAAEKLKAETSAFTQTQDARLQSVRDRLASARGQTEVSMPDETKIKEDLIRARKNVSDLKFKVRDCTPSANASLTVAQLRSRLAKLRHQKASLAAKLRDLTYIKEDQLRTQAVGTNNDVSEGQSDETATVSTISIRSASSSVDSASDAGTESLTGPDSEDERQPSEAALQNPFVSTRAEEEALFRHVESRQLRDALRKEASLQELVEQILLYLVYGTSIWKITATDVTKMFMYVNRASKKLILCNFKEDSSGRPDRDSPVEVVDFKEIKNIVLGQYSDTFLKWVDPSPANLTVTAADGIPDDEDIERTKNILPHFYRSFSIKTDKRTTLDLITCEMTDFEAWVVALHHITIIDPAWGKPLDLTEYDGFGLLSAEEQAMCSINHLAPARFISAKSLLTKDKLYITLYDVRTLTDCDLLHSQKVFEFFTKQDWVEKVSVWMLKKQKDNILQQTVTQQQLPGGALP